MDPSARIVEPAIRREIMAIWPHFPRNVPDTRTSILHELRLHHATASFADVQALKAKISRDNRIRNGTSTAPSESNMSSSTYYNAPSTMFLLGPQTTPQPASPNVFSPPARLTPQPPRNQSLPPTTMPAMTESEQYGMKVFFESAYGSLRKGRKEDESVATLPLAKRFEAFGVAFNIRNRQRKAVNDAKDSAKEAAKLRRAAGRGKGGRKEADRLLVELNLTVEFKGLESIRSGRTRSQRLYR